MATLSPFYIQTRKRVGEPVHSTVELAKAQPVVFNNNGYVIWAIAGVVRKKRADVHFVISLDDGREEPGDGGGAVEFKQASQKKRQISALALGPLGSPYLLDLGEPDQA